MNKEQQVTRNKNEADWQLLHYKLQFHKLVESVKKDDYVVTSDDADGFTTAIKFIDYIKKVKGFELKIGGFFRIGTNKSTISFADDKPIPDDNLICCDIALEHGFTSNKPIRCIDNHVCKLVDNDYFNPMSVNFNDSISCQNYTQKSATSSLLTLLTLADHTIMYDDDKNYYTQRQQELIMCVDGTFYALTGNYDGYINLWQYVWAVDTHFKDVLDVRKSKFKLIQRLANLNALRGDDKMYVNKKGELKLNLSDYSRLAEGFDNLDLSYLNDLKFKSFIDYDRFTDTTYNKNKADLIKEHGDILNLSVVKKGFVVGCVVTKNSTVQYYEN